MLHTITILDVLNLAQSKYKSILSIAARGDYRPKLPYQSFATKINNYGARINIFRIEPFRYKEQRALNIVASEVILWHSFDI